jgi:hypothetical protein
MRTVQLDPTNREIVALGTEDLSRSTDGGVSGFKILGVGTLHVDHHAFAFSPANHDTLLDGNDGGIFQGSTNFSNGGVNPTWTSLNSNLANVEFYGGTIDAGAPNDNTVRHDVALAVDNQSPATVLVTWWEGFNNGPETIYSRRLRIAGGSVTFLDTGAIQVNQPVLQLKGDSVAGAAANTPIRSRPKAPGWRFILRAAAVVAVGIGIMLWPRSNHGYGIAFWLWAGGVVTYPLSFQGGRPVLPRPRRSVQLTLLGVLVLAAALRLVAIEDVPALIHIDEILPAAEALHIVEGNAPNVFSSVGWFTTPNLAFAFPALTMEVTHHDWLFAARLTSAIMGTVGILFLFLLGRRLFGDRVALIASFLMAVSFWHIHDSRTAFSYVQASFCTALVLYLLVRARQDRSRATLAVAGIALGLALECYFPTRILLLVCPLFWLNGGSRDPVRTTTADVATFGLGALLVLTPLLNSVPWRVIAGHSQQVWLIHASEHFERTYHVVGLPAVFFRNLKESAAMFTEWANPCVWHQTPAGLLDMGTLVALILGVLAAILRADAHALLLVAWAALTFVLGVAFTDAPRAAYRLAAAIRRWFSSPPTVWNACY